MVLRHVERTECEAPLTWQGRDVTCGFEHRAPVHDLFPVIAKRDRLPESMTEDDRHEYQPTGSGICDADEDDWPCAARQLADELLVDR